MVDNPELVTVMRLLVLAHKQGFTFRALWGERETGQYRDVIFLGGITGNCNATRSYRGLLVPGEPLITKRASGDALTVLHAVVSDWPQPAD